MKNCVINHPRNTQGRDFIVGDLHAQMPMLRKLLKYVGFSPEKDRLFSTGDLIHRGPESKEALDLVREPWFYPVLGNHDAMLLAATYRWSRSGPEFSLPVDRRTYAEAFYYNDGFDGNLSEDMDTSMLLDVPLVRTVGAGETIDFGLLHASCFVTEEKRLSLEELHGLTEKTCRKSIGYIYGFEDCANWADSLLWGRPIEGLTGFSGNREGPPIFVGHTIRKIFSGEIVWADNHVFLDTGAFYAKWLLEKGKFDPDFGLTIFEPATGEGVMINARDKFEHVVLRR